jgi:hypothetical protein
MFSEASRLSDHRDARITFSCAKYGRGSYAVARLIERHGDMLARELRLGALKTGARPGSSRETIRPKSAGLLAICLT